MSNKKLYKETFEQITMSEEGFEKLRSMEGKSKKNGIQYFKYAGIAVAAMAAIFISSNTISYAATGKALVDVKEYAERIFIFINGKKADESDVKKYVDENGKEHIEMEVGEGDQKGEVHIVADMDALDEYNLSMNQEIHTTGDTDVEVSLYSWEIIKKEGKVYLNIGNGKEVVDITKDIEDGKAEGKVQIDGGNYKYLVEDFGDTQSVSIQKAE